MEEENEEEDSVPIPVTALPHITVVLESAKHMVRGKTLDTNDDVVDEDLEKCLKEPELENREEVDKEDDLEILSKGDNISERENAENESRSEENQSNKNDSRLDKLGTVIKTDASAISQQPTSLGQNDQVRHYYAKILTADHYHCPLPGARI